MTENGISKGTKDNYGISTGTKKGIQDKWTSVVILD